jgi:hypothetical protein
VETRIDEVSAELAGLPLLLTVEETAAVLRVGRTLAYQLARLYDTTDGREGLPTIRLGRVLRVPRWALAHYLAHGRPAQHMGDGGDAA